MKNEPRGRQRYEEAGRVASDRGSSGTGAKAALPAATGSERAAREPVRRPSTRLRACGYDGNSCVAESFPCEPPEQVDLRRRTSRFC
jgi:hypothetical protein